VTSNRHQRRSEEQGHQHGEVGAGVADHEPESLSGAGEFGDFGGDDGGADDNESGMAAMRVRNRGEQGSAEDLKGADDMGSECGMEKPILVKRLTPMLGSMNLRTPWVKKIRPTLMRTRRMAGSERNELGAPLRVHGFNFRGYARGCRKHPNAQTICVDQCAGAEQLRSG